MTRPAIPSNLACVDLPTVEPHLPLTPCQWTNIPHVDHRRSKALKEAALVTCVAVDNGGRSGARVDLLVRQQKPLPVLKVEVVVAVEGVGGGRVEIVEASPVFSVGALILQQGQVGGVQARVWPLRAAVVVEAGGEGLTLRTPEGVGSWVHEIMVAAVVPC